MSELAPAPQCSAAIARAERRMWLLDLMLALCAALLAVVRSDQSCVAFLQWARATACGPIARATGMAQMLKTETERRLFALRATEARRADAAPAAKRAPRPERAEAPERKVRAAREASCATTNDADAFRARVEAFEAFLDRQGPSAQLPPPDLAGRLCDVLGLSPDWSRWLDDGWLAANLDLNRPLPGPAPAPLALPPPPHPSPPAPRAEEASFAVPDDPAIRQDYIPGYKEALGKRMLDAIDLFAPGKAQDAFLRGILEQRLATNEPWMWGCNWPLRGAVNRMCEKLRLSPEWKLWDCRDNDWIDDGYNHLRRNSTCRHI